MAEAQKKIFLAVWLILYLLCSYVVIFGVDARCPLSFGESED